MADQPKVPVPQQPVVPPIQQAPALTDAEIAEVRRIVYASIVLPNELGAAMPNILRCVDALADVRRLRLVATEPAAITPSTKK